MGRIKTQLIKRMSNLVVKEHRDEFKKDFEENKAILAKFVDIPSKKLRNGIAGYVTRLMKEEK